MDPRRPAAGADTDLFLSVVVPAYNEEKLLPATLNSICRSMAGVGLTRFEVVVCDNASTDRTAELATAAGARVVPEPIRQIARARNAGAAAAQGQWLLFVDADSLPDAALIGDMLGEMRSGEVVGGGSTLRMTGIGMGYRAILGLWNRLSRWRRWMAGSFIFCRRDLFDELEGFSDDLFVAEEIDFSLRLGRLAKPRRKRVSILHRHPLLTSARKVELYTPREFLLLLWRALRHPRRIFQDPSLCSPWYDGRR